LMDTSSKTQCPLFLSLFVYAVSILSLMDTSSKTAKAPGYLIIPHCFNPFFDGY
jgi:hypothetical protein